MAKLKPARKGAKGSGAAQMARGLPCLLLVIFGIILLGLLFYLVMKGSA
jgi:hypothetical protein